MNVWHRCLVTAALLLSPSFSMTLAQSTTTPATAPIGFDSPGASNPILPGYYADPSVVVQDGKFYIYATFDPWGFDTLSCWESTDFKDWTLHPLNWPTKKACTSPTSAKSMVWAPSVVKAADGKFYMYVSVGSEVWVGTADAPLGPWRNALGDKPLIAKAFDERYHMIDAEAFIDENGQAYLYWGSGWNYKNGHCFAVKLKPDMITFDGTPQDITPANYFEGPIVLKHAGKYYLMSSNGKVGEDTYRVHCARADHPLGPFTDGVNSPVLVTHADRHVSGPGHNGLIRWAGQDYIVYHRNATDRKGAYRQLCVDRIEFDDDGWMKPILPTHDGATELQNAIGRVDSGKTSLLRSATLTASSSIGDANAPRFAADDNYSTRWIAGPKTLKAAHWLQADFGKTVALKKTSIRTEYGSRTYKFAVESSTDGQTWKTLADHRKNGVSGSPIDIDVNANVRYLRLTYADTTTGEEAAIWNWSAE